MSLSANTLFHFTDSIENLALILSNKFKPSDCLEYFPGEERNLPGCARAFPMVCFCDIRISQLRVHTENYGKFGIGLYKSWGIEKGLSPITYTHNDSHTNSAMNKLFKVITEKSRSLPLEDAKEIIANLIDLKKYFKPYQGPYWDKKQNKFSDENRIFYDEREWRYILNLEGLINTITYDKFRSNTSNISERLDFQIENVKYLFIEDDSYVAKLKERLLELNLIEKEEVDLYISKIITIKNIEEDF